MHAQLIMFVMCLLAALALPAWGGAKKTVKPKAPSQTAITPASIAQAQSYPGPIILPGGYVRDPSKPMQARQYMKALRQKQKEAAANRAAARARQGGSQEMKGGTP